LSQLTGGDLAETLFVLYMGCETASGDLLSATTGRGAHAAAGFDEPIGSELNAVFSSAFWGRAVHLMSTIWDAEMDGIAAVENAAGGDPVGYDSFYATDFDLRLWPARFAGACVGAP
jgi:hypothetical protein